MKKILVLPDAGPQNPFQYQMVEVLRGSGLTVVKSTSKRFFATLSAFHKHKPDVVYYDWIQSFILGKTLLITLLKCLCFYIEINYLTRIKRTPIVHTLHNMHNHAKRWVYIERWMYTYFLKKCTRIRVYAESTRSKVVAQFGTDPKRIYIIQDVPFHYYYPNHTSFGESRNYLQISPQKFVYLSLGMMKPYKGIEELVKAFSKVSGENDVLIIAGPTDSPMYVESIRQLINNHPNILLHNRLIENDKLQMYFNSANVVVLPFRNIEHSSSIDLAMSFKKPIITLRTDFMQHLLAHQQELLFESEHTLGDKLIKARSMNLQDIGQANYQIADRSNYKDFVLLFQNLQPS